MHMKQKRAQFFLIATLVIVTILFSFSIVYNFASSSSSGSRDAEQLAKAIKYEGVQIINNGVNDNKDSPIIENNLFSLGQQYSEIYTSYDIIMIFESTAMKYESGSGTTLASSSSPKFEQDISNKNTLTLNSISYTFKTTDGYDFNVVVQNDVENERYIAKA